MFKRTTVTPISKSFYLGYPSNLWTRDGLAHNARVPWYWTPLAMFVLGPIIGYGIAQAYHWFNAHVVISFL